MNEQVSALFGLINSVLTPTPATPSMEQYRQTNDPDDYPFPPEATQESDDFNTGLHDYPSRHSRNNPPSHDRRCPFRRPERVAAWHAGYAYAHDQIMRMG